MTFNSLVYAAFLPLVVVTYWRLPRGGQNRLLLAASYVFYGWWDWRFCTLLALSTLVDWAVARRLDATDDPRRRRQLLAVSVAVNLGILASFKYAGFFVASAASLLESVGLSANVPTLSIVLPVGISFYTFQSLSYTIDVYRRELPAVGSLVDVALYVSFFPQLVAGPIERASRLLPQLTTDRTRPDGDQLSAAFVLIVMGLAKKVVIADTLAPIADAAFSQPGTASGLTLAVGALAFAMQLYGDFSGYTDIARGSAKLFGIELMRNFAQPHLSRNVTEIWRTWHISLSSWLRDYLYVPLGGNRGGRVATYRNLFLVMLLGGLWHGAAWTFVVWGGLHGVWLASHRAWCEWRGVPAIPDDGRLALGRRLVTFAGWTALLVVFRSASLTDAGAFLHGIATLRGGIVSLEEAFVVLVGATALLVIDLVQRANDGDDVRGFVARPALVRATTAGLTTVGLVVASGATPVPFVYFQF